MLKKHLVERIRSQLLDVLEHSKIAQRMFLRIYRIQDAVVSLRIHFESSRFSSMSKIHASKNSTPLSISRVIITNKMTRRKSRKPTINRRRPSVVWHESLHRKVRAENIALPFLIYKELPLNGTRFHGLDSSRSRNSTTFKAMSNVSENIFTV